MLKPKRLYTFMLQTFLPVFAMTFFICLFIVLMQFLFRYVDDMVGKGLDISVIAELFFYAAMTMVPMALPLAILLASLMTFGNLGEKFELTAMKASGVSLIKSMRPLIVLVAVIAIGAFFFQNNVLPVAQTKMWTLLFSMRQKSPEMEITEKVFCEINGYNFYVERKDKETGMLYDLIIYDGSRGFDNSSIILADSGRIDLTKDKTRLVLTLASGEQFENLRRQSGATQQAEMPYRRESFVKKDIIIPFDANFNRMDESTMKKQYIGKNISQLRHSIDSINSRIDSIGNVYANELVNRQRFDMYGYRIEHTDTGITKIPRHEVVLSDPIDIDSLFNRDPALSRSTILTQALYKARQVKQENEFKSYTISDDRKTMRRHDIEMQKKFTLSFACLIFFFIGAPLGAIIKKGGLGFPLLVSVLLFIVYYIIDNTGYKMARDGKIEVFEGMWLSSAILLPLGVFLTYKAMQDSVVINLDFIKKLNPNWKKKLKRNIEVKDFVMNDVNIEEVRTKLVAFDKNLINYISISKFKLIKRRKLLKQLNDSLECIVAGLSDVRSPRIIAAINAYPMYIGKDNIARIQENNKVVLQLLDNLNVIQ